MVKCTEFNLLFFLRCFRRFRLAKASLLTWRRIKYFHPLTLDVYFLLSSLLFVFFPLTATSQRVQVHIHITTCVRACLSHFSFPLLHYMTLHCIFSLCLCVVCLSRISLLSEGFSLLFPCNLVYLLFPERKGCWSESKVNLKAQKQKQLSQGAISCLG